MGVAMVCGFNHGLLYYRVDGFVKHHEVSSNFYMPVWRTTIKCKVWIQCMMFLLEEVISELTPISRHDCDMKTLSTANSR